MSVRWFCMVAGAWIVLMGTPDRSLAQENFPNRPIRVVTPYAPGTVADVFGRIVVQNMATQWNAMPARRQREQKPSSVLECQSWLLAPAPARPRIASGTQGPVRDTG